MTNGTTAMGQLLLQIWAALTITNPDRTITNQNNYKLLQFGKYLSAIRVAITNQGSCWKSVHGNITQSDHFIIE